jgi:hypothetical protein
MNAEGKVTDASIVFTRDTTTIAVWICEEECDDAMRLNMNDVRRFWCQKWYQNCLLLLY